MAPRMRRSAKVSNLMPRRFVEALGRVDEPDDAVLNEVAQVDGVRHGRGHAARQRLHKGESRPRSVRNPRLDTRGRGIRGVVVSAGVCSTLMTVLSIHRPRGGAPAFGMRPGVIWHLLGAVGLCLPNRNLNASVVQRRGGACIPVEELR